MVNGDLIEGDHHKTMQIVSPDIGDHIEIAKQVLGPLAELADAVMVVRGTECHTGTAEEAIARHLGALVNPDTGTRAADRWEFSVQGVHCVASHHISSTTRDWLRGTALSQTLASEQLSAARSGRASVPRVVFRAHRHVCDVIQSAGAGMVGVTPPWQLLTRFGSKVVPNAPQDLQVGGLFVDFLVDEGDLPNTTIIRYRAEEPTVLPL